MPANKPMMDTMDNCLITGTSTGIGYAAAIHLARNGFRIHATMRDLTTKGPLQEIIETEKVPIVIHRLDVTDRSSIDEVVTDILDSDGHIDILINNAGLSNACPMEIYPEDEHRLLFETNYWGPVHLTQAVLPGMRAQGRGSIVNVSSILGRVAVVNQAAYCASKFAIEAFSESLALEVAPMGLRVIIIEPGVIATPIFEKTPIHYDKKSPYRQAMRQGGRFYRASIPQATPPEEVAEIMLQALTSEQPQLRWLHGHGASLVEQRPNIQDEDYIAMTTLDDETYNARFKDFFGIDLAVSSK
ncbi:MAG: Cyclopentanol dehydrogenase [Alphaproteobacteria bacterium MarineAlpha9_Bin7]|nr:MAG: Cyclopentanol dehydrogenase [Alphaproteobacteria bacterium MarineAlpha9_Bin7]